MTLKAWARTPEAWLFGALALFAFAPRLVLAGGGEVFNGAEPGNVGDYMQYMGMIRDAGENVLISNKFDVVDDPHIFLHPTFLISGLVWKLGASIQFTLAMWKPVVLVLLFGGFAAYVRRLLAPSRGAMAAALALALFFLTPATFLTDWLDASQELQFGTAIVGYEMFAAMFTWGTGSGPLSVALMPFFFLAVERLLRPELPNPRLSIRWYAAGAGVAGMFCSWLHPWQGITLLLVVAGLAVWERRRPRELLRLAIPLALTVAPLAYMWALGQTDSAWAEVSAPNDMEHVTRWLFLGMAPLLLALPGFRGRDLDTQDRILRLWPVAAMVLYFALGSSWFYHAFNGLTLPLAILTVQGLRGFGIPRLAVAALVVLVTVPGTAYTLIELRKARADHFFTAEENAALEFLDESPREGAVLAPRVPLGEAVPAFTGRNTYVGHYTWTPGHDGRAAEADALFSGGLTPAQARELVVRSRAAFLASDCRGREDIAELLGPMLVERRRFGCATVYEVRPD